MTARDPWEKVLLCCRFALEKKAHDLVIMDVRNLTTVADYLIVCTGRSDTQVQSIVRGIEENMRSTGVSPFSVEGYTHGQWALLDYSDVIVHVFYQPVREFYDLERLWSQAPQRELPEPYQSQARELRAGT